LIKYKAGIDDTGFLLLSISLINTDFNLVAGIYRCNQIIPDLGGGKNAKSGMVLIQQLLNNYKKLPV